MQSRILTTILTATLALPVVALAEQASKAPADQPLTRAQSVEARATVTAIDPATRTVTLKNEEGETFPVQAGSAVENFDQDQSRRHRQGHVHGVDRLPGCS